MDKRGRTDRPLFRAVGGKGTDAIRPIHDDTTRNGSFAHWLSIQSGWSGGSATEVVKRVRSSCPVKPCELPEPVQIVNLDRTIFEGDQVSFT